MSNRLADLDRVVQRQFRRPARAAAPLPAQDPGRAARQAAVAPAWSRSGIGGLAALPGRDRAGLGDLARTPPGDDALSAGLSVLSGRAGGRRRPRTLSVPVGYTVPGTVPVLAQPSTMACWATVFAMMQSWREQRSMTIETALATVGQRWVDVYQQNTGLSTKDKTEFLAAAGLVGEPPASWSVEGWEGLLRSCGPLWVTTDEQVGPSWGIHARVVTAIHGDGTPEGTRLSLIDPAGGRTYDETFAVFLPKFEEEARDPSVTHLRIQIVHWPAGISVAASMTAVATAPATARPSVDAELERLRAEGVPESELRAFLDGFASPPPPTALSLPLSVDGSLVTLPAITLLDGRLGRLLIAMVADSWLGSLVAPITALVTRRRTTVAVGAVATAGLGAGVTGGVGVVFAPDGRVGYYGSTGAVGGWIASVSAGLQLILVDGGVERFAGDAIARTVSLDMSEGPGIGASELRGTDGSFLGLALTAQLSSGVPVLAAMEAYVERNRTTTTLGWPPPAPRGWPVRPSRSMGFAAPALAVAMAEDIPLSPSAGGRSIGPDALQTGDVILSTTDKLVSKAIRAAMGSTISHSLIYVGDEMVVEAIASGVVLQPLARSIGDASVAVAFRHPGLTPDLALQVRDFVGTKIGQPYDRWLILDHARFRMPARICEELYEGEQRRQCRERVGRVYLGTATNDEFICSELVAAAFASAGLPLTTEPPHWVTPEDLARMRFSGHLEYVGHLKA
ncbi:papain-like cysteine protease family protein [Geodermatophilus sp. SYSU D00697]